MTDSKLLALPLIAAIAGACAGGSAAPRQAAAPASEAPAAAAPAHKTGAARELSPRAQRLFDEAVAAADEQKKLKVPTDWEVLERRWRAVVDAEPVPEAWFNLGVILEKRHEQDDARAAYRKALSLEPDLAPAAVNLALLEEPRDPAQAAVAWQAVLRRFPQEAVPRVRLAALYLAAGQLDEAKKFAREALVRDPRATGAYAVMMRVALQRGQLDLAQLLAVKAQKIDESDPEVAAALGDVLLARHDDAGATAQWKKALAMRDGYLPARYALLKLALAKQQWESVAEQASAILAANPKEARVQLALGVAYRYLGQPDKALAAYEQAEKLAEGKLPEVNLARAILFIKSKDQCEPALPEIRRYVALAGPGVASEGPAMRLERECVGIIAANKQAEEAAREMKAEQERAAAKKAEQERAAAKKPETPTKEASPEAATAADAPQTARRASAGAGADGPTK
jgi:Tfp pilus assembly protein PilF